MRVDILSGLNCGLGGRSFPEYQTWRTNDLRKHWGRRKSQLIVPACLWKPKPRRLQEVQRAPDLLFDSPRPVPKGFHLSTTLQSGEISEVSSVKGGFPSDVSGKEPICQFRRLSNRGLIPRLGRSPGGGHRNPLQYSCLENPMDRKTWQATVHRVTQSTTWLKWLSMYTCILHFYLVYASRSFLYSFAPKKGPAPTLQPQLSQARKRRKHPFAQKSGVPIPNLQEVREAGERLSLASCRCCY